MTFNAAEWRAEILEVVDDCNHRCLPWEEQHRRVEKVALRLYNATLQQAADACLAEQVRCGIPPTPPHEPFGRTPWEQCARVIWAMFAAPAKEPPT